MPIKKIKRFNVIPESIITGDLNTDIQNDSYFKSLIFNPLCLNANQNITKAKPTFYPRGKGNPKALDWVLLPPSFLEFNIDCSLLPQTTPPISDHLLTTITLKNSLNRSNSNFPKRKIPISNLLFRKSDVQDGINLCSKRFSEQFKNEPIKAIDSFRYHTFCLLRDLSIDQAKQNKKLINEIKDLSYKNQSPSKEASERLNEIITERILSSRERFYKFIAQSRHSPSKAMTLMSSESSISKRPRVEDADIHLKFWIDHFKNVDTYDHTPKEQKQNIEFFLNYVKSDGNILSNKASTSLSNPITVNEVEFVIITLLFKVVSITLSVLRVFYV